ncbi:MAG: ester cyclase [Solirubrobacteraceae bacterium]
MSEAIEVVRSFLAAWSASGFAVELADVCEPDVHYEDPLTSKPLIGPAALAEHVARLRTGAPDARLEPTGEPLTDGRFVATPVRLLATHSGQLGDFPPSGREVVAQVMFYCELGEDRDRLWRIRAFYDIYDAAIQLGVLPKPGSTSARALMMLRGFGLRPTP